MKRIIVLVLLLTIFATLLVGCTPEFDLETCITNLEANGFVVKTSWIKPDSTTSYSVNGERIIVIGQTLLTLDGNGAMYVKIEIFENEKLAKTMYDYFLGNLRKSSIESTLKVAYYDNIVIACTDESAMEIIGLKFEN